MEKIIDNHIRSGPLMEIPLHHNQHAYRAGRSTETALYQLTKQLEYTMEFKEVCICAFLDIEGAFDNTSHPAVQKALGAKRVGKGVTHWIGELLRTRQAEMQVGTGTTKVSTTRGCPQGGVLSPLLWSLVVDELLTLLSAARIDCQGYADDIVIIARGKVESTLCESIQKGLNITKNWCKTAGLNLNPKKTAVVVFTRRTKLPGMKPILLNGVEVASQKQFKYLGVTLDSTLIWDQHVNNVCEKATTAMMICRRLAGKSWGCNPKILHWMFNSIVKPRITYGAVAWATRMDVASARTQLAKVQRLASVSITGAMRSCPTKALEIILGLPPIHLAVVEVAHLTIARFCRQGFGIGKIISSKHGEEICKDLPMLGMPMDEMTRKILLLRNFTTELSNKANWTSVGANYKIGTDSIIWYTDGSKTKEGTGAGVFGPRTKYTEPLGTFPSIFQAEMHAIERCAALNLDRGFSQKSIAILSDSQAAIKAIGSDVITSKITWDCITRLNELGQNNKVTIYWVPGHKNIHGNEMADELARRGSSTPLTGPAPFCGINSSTITTTLKERYFAEWMEEWTYEPGLRQAKAALGTFSGKRTTECLSLTKNRLRVLTGILTGHCKLRGHLFHMGKVESSECRFCKLEKEEPIHLLTNCLATAARRRRTLGSYFLKIAEVRRLSPGKILHFLEVCGLLEIL